MKDVLSRIESVEGIRARLSDPLYLPTNDEVQRAFTFEPPYQGFTDFQRYIMTTFDGLIYNYPTKKYIEGLGTYLEQRIGQIRGSTETILEVAAGAGRLSYFLNKRLSASIPNSFQIIATDNFSWDKTNFSIGAPVENLDYEFALQQYRPEIVLGAWLPKVETEEDTASGAMTKTIRRTPSVQEMILIGNPFTHASKDAFGFEKNIAAFEKVPPFPGYSRDGFMRKNLKFLDPYLYSLFDRRSQMCQSRTITFSRFR